MITALNRLTSPPATPDEAQEMVYVADLAAQLILSGATSLEQLAADQTEAGIIALFASMKAQEMRAGEYPKSRPLTASEAFKIAFVGSL